MTWFRRLGDWFVRHFGPGPSLYEVQAEITRLRQEWADMQDYLNRWTARQAKRDERDTKRRLDAMAQEQDEAAPQPTDHKAELRQRALALNANRRRA